MFVGTHEASLDAKSRVNFPAKLRDAIPEPERRGLMLTWHYDACLVLYTASEWAKIDGACEEKGRASPEWNEDVVRVLYANADRVDLDGVGRILIPEQHRRWADLRKNLVFVGVRRRIEIWDQERWNADEQKRAESFKRLGREILR